MAEPSNLQSRAGEYWRFTCPEKGCWFWQFSTVPPSGAQRVPPHYHNGKDCPSIGLVWTGQLSVGVDGAEKPAAEAPDNRIHFHEGDRIRWSYGGETDLGTFIEYHEDGVHLRYRSDVTGRVAKVQIGNCTPLTDIGRPKADPFDKVLSEIKDINRRKRADYAGAGDIFSNFKDVGHQLGATAGTAVEAHIATKQSRLRQLLQPGREPRNESVRDTLLDRATYAVIALALYDEGLYSQD